MVYSHPLYGRVPTALLTGRKQFPFHETIKIKLSVNSTKVTACNLITPEMRAVNPVMYHPTHTGLYAASHRSHCQNTAEMHSLLVFRCFLVAIAALPAMESQVFIPFWDALQKLARWHQISPSMLYHLCSHQRQVSSALSPHPEYPTAFLERTQWNCTTDKFVFMTFSVTKTHLPFGQC